MISPVTLLSLQMFGLLWLGASGSITTTTIAPPRTASTTTTTTTTPPTTSTTPPTTIPPNSTTTSTPSPRDSKIWVLLVAGSMGFYNYRHQADICHAYQIVHANGIPDENIIVMMYDDIANSDDNVYPGKIYNKPGGPDVYKGVPKDYTLNDVNPTNFINILKGNKEALAGIGSGRVIESGPNDHIFVNFVDHGGPGVLYFPTNEELMADELISNITQMANNKQFEKLVLYVEACYSGSMFQNLLKDDLNVFVTTAADPYESSYACYQDDSLGTYLGDVFSVNWMEDTEQEILTKESLNHQFEVVRAETKTSHVEEYGDLDLGLTKLSTVIGYKPMRMRKNGWSMKNEKSFIKFKDAVPSIDVPPTILKKKLDNTKEVFDRMELKMSLHVMKQKRLVVDKLISSIISDVAVGNSSKITDITDSKTDLNQETFYCYKTIYREFSDKCLNVAKNIYVTTHLSKFVNFCNLPWTRLPVMLDAINNHCSKGNFSRMGLKNVI
ncbi:LOW QUALITY PROTEIN: legumain [Nilaparvata lugens]|uniref:LOW QUALITY PROTEIN: legumain n=1 Tax=Nilaparvata lugens TaxID=108931 RepID=UPI00193C9D38|nr:LOW QUALITY PROTEIN: legumain [Nilaparvata lugens]